MRTLKLPPPQRRRQMKRVNPQMKREPEMASPMQMGMMAAPKLSALKNLRMALPKKRK